MSSVVIRRAAALTLALGVLASAQAAPSQQGEKSAASISGHVTVGGKPAPRVLVVVESFAGAATSGLPKTTTDDEGNYRLKGVPEGQFVVKVAAPAYVAAEGADANQRGRRLFSSNGLSGYILSVAEGDKIESINFELTRGGVITGRVTDASGEPVIEAHVTCSQIVQGSSSGASGTDKTDDRGVYRIYGLPSGNYLVSVSLAKKGLRPYRQTFYPGVTSNARATSVTVENGGESREIDIRLGQPDKIYSIRGRVVDEASGHPIPGLSLSFHGLYGSSVGFEGFATSDQEGRFEIRDNPPGRYQLQVAFTGSPNQGYYSDTLSFEVTDANITGLELKATRGATIKGAVVIEGSNDPSLLNRVPYLTAEQVPPEGQAGRRLVFVSTTVGKGGAFEFKGVRPGQTKIVAGGLPEGLSMIRVERDGTTITEGMNISPGEQVSGLRVVLAYGTGSIRGQAKIVGGSLPTKFGWVLEISRPGGERFHAELLDASGLFWVKGLSPGTYEVTAILDYAEVQGMTFSPAPVKQTVTVANGRESRVLLELNLSKN